MANVSMRDLLKAGAHFGHQTRYWNPKMAPFDVIHLYVFHLTAKRLSNGCQWRFRDRQRPELAKICPGHALYHGGRARFRVPTSIYLAIFAAARGPSRVAAHFVGRRGSSSCEPS